MKAVLLFAITLVTSQMCFGQMHDESFRSGDPVKSIQVYPNPALDYLVIKFELPVAKTSKLSFHSIIGSSIELEQETIDEFEIRVKVKDLPVGYYIVAIQDTQNNSRAIHKFLKR
ncbi:MAG TPA: T9SS type A sorting domain-containing protein [Cyclobacteriaceae bacterium]|nr:T9SS type A sorting domain-containing protein [Cyclobacteriaceae bacterium]